jgi:ankyrin repeat protein
MAALTSYYSESELEPIVQALLDAGASPNSPPSETHTSALQTAIDSGNLRFVDRLLDAGADVNAYDPRFGTAMLSVARWNRVEIMKKLAEKGAGYTLGDEKYG